jgi:hypothetical protein
VATSPQFSFDINALGDGEHAVAAAVLVQVLQNAQRAFELIGLFVEGKEVKERARVPAAFSRRYQLVCSLPEPGSYAVPITVGSFPDDLIAEQSISRALNTFLGLMSAVSSRSVSDVRAAIGDGPIRRRVLEALKGMAPRPGAGWTLDVYDREQHVLARVDEDTAAFMLEVIAPEADRQDQRTVTGELESINFSERKVTILYPVNNQELECIYEDSVEEMLLENRRRLIQVTGRVVVDADHMPKKIIEVTDIKDLDMSPFEVDQIRHGSVALRARRTLELEPTLDESKQYLTLLQSELGIDVFAETREKLRSELFEQIAMLWTEYALAPPEQLSPEAIRLKGSLLNLFEPTENAS